MKERIDTLCRRFNACSGRFPCLSDNFGGLLDAVEKETFRNHSAQGRPFFGRRVKGFAVDCRENLHVERATGLVRSKVHD